jgi:tetratricopeptide (TPR) repeat protein
MPAARTMTDAVTRGPRAIRPPAVALLLLLASAAAGASQATPDKRYAQIVALYASGERAAAVSELGEIPDHELKKELKTLEKTLGPGAPACLVCEKEISLHAALMLHTDRALAERVQLRQGEEEPECADSIQFRAASEIGEILAYRGGEHDDSARRWAVAMAMRARADGCMQDAVRFVDMGLKWYARDPVLLLVRGVVHETIATVLMRPAKVPLAGLTGKRLQQARGVDMQYRRDVDLSIQSFEDALSANPDLVEARVRLGRMEWLAGHPDKARAALEAALQADPPPALAYLVHLFLGRCDEDAGRLEDAEREYRAALDLDPSAQVAGVALSHAVLMAGDEPAAQRVLKAALGHARRKEGDVYWSYPLGGVQFSEGMFEQLRGESLR